MRKYCLHLQCKNRQNKTSSIQIKAGKSINNDRTESQHFLNPSQSWWRQGNQVGLKSSHTPHSTCVQPGGSCLEQRMRGRHVRRKVRRQVRRRKKNSAKLLVLVWQYKPERSRHKGSSRSPVLRPPPGPARKDWNRPGDREPPLRVQHREEQPLLPERQATLKPSRAGDPAFWDLQPDDLRWSWPNSRNKVHNKCNALESHCHQPQTVGPWKNSPTKPVPGPKRWGTAALGHS